MKVDGIYCNECYVKKKKDIHFDKYNILHFYTLLQHPFFFFDLESKSIALLELLVVVTTALEEGAF